MEYLEKMSYDLAHKEKELPEGYNELSIVNDQLHVLVTWRKNFFIIFLSRRQKLSFPSKTNCGEVLDP